MTDLTEQVKTEVAPPAYPAEFAGTIGIEWPAMQDQSTTATMPGWAVSLFDDQGPVVTVIALQVVHASATGPIWAELLMYATEDGKPLLHPGKGDDGAEVIPVDDRGEPIFGSFPFLVASMRVKGS